MCVTAEQKYVPFLLLTAYRAAELLVNTLKDNIKINIKEINTYSANVENMVSS
jgi:hypothetical protein